MDWVLQMPENLQRGRVLLLPFDANVPPFDELIKTAYASIEVLYGIMRFACGIIAKKKRMQLSQSWIFVWILVGNGSSVGVL